MVSHVASLISTVCDTLEEYFLDQFSPWKIITLSVAITVTVKVKITGVSILKSSPKPASLSDRAFKNLHTFLLLSVYVAIYSVAPIPFWQQIPAGHFFVKCWGKISKIFTRLYKDYTLMSVWKVCSLCLPTFICKLKNVFSGYSPRLIFFYCTTEVTYSTFRSWV